MPAAVQVICNPHAAASALEPSRRALLERLAQPNSAAGLARDTGIPRQKLNYHLKQLEKDGLVEFVEERRKGNCLERIVQASARQYLISPEALGKLGRDTSEIRDRFSSAYLISAAARVIGDVASVRERADAAGKSVPTLTIETEVTFSSAEERNAFANELAGAVAHFAAKYNRCSRPKSRSYKILIGAYPKPPAPKEQP
jgi:DNA-binding transcriptional ArsR family regulator